MRTLRIALILALAAGATVASFDQSAFAKGTGGAAGGAAGGGAAGGGAAGGGTGGAGAGSNPNMNPIETQAVILQGHPHRYVRQAPVPAHDSSSCFKQDSLYDRYGYPVFNLHGVDCYE